MGSHAVGERERGGDEVLLDGVPCESEARGDLRRGEPVHLVQGDDAARVVRQRRRDTQERCKLGVARTRASRPGAAGESPQSL
jgi:hypothetical protein